MTDYADIEKALVEWVKTRPLVAGAGNRTPADLDSQLNFVRIVHLGGTDDDVTDSPVVDVDVFSLSRDDAKKISEDIRQSLRPRVRAGGAIIDSVRTSTSPRQLPWSNEKIKRYSATYALGLRR